MRELFLLQIVAGAVAAVVFRLGLDPRVAGLIAGSAFIAVGIFGVRAGWVGRRHLLVKAVLGLSIVHLCLVAFPMLLFRILNWSEPFSKTSVWGLSGPEFHEVSTKIYSAWVVLVVAAWGAAARRNAKVESRASDTTKPS